MKLFLLVLVALMAVAVVACGGGPTKFEKGKLVSGIITSSDTNVEGWNSQTYVVDIFEGVEYFIRLTSTDGNVMGIWSTDAEDSIVEVNSDVDARTVAYPFAAPGAQSPYVRTLDSNDR